jgi:hypothetical protein
MAVGFEFALPVQGAMRIAAIARQDVDVGEFMVYPRMLPFIGSRPLAMSHDTDIGAVDRAVELSLDVNRLAIVLR